MGSKEAELHRDCLLWILEIDTVEEVCTACLHCNIHFGCTLFPLSIDCLLENEIRSCFNTFFISFMKFTLFAKSAVTLSIRDGTSLLDNKNGLLVLHVVSVNYRKTGK